jgi:hypothetical protein
MVYQTNYDKGVIGDVLPNAAPKRLNGPKFLLQERKVPVKILMPMVFRKIIGRTFGSRRSSGTPSPFHKACGNCPKYSRKGCGTLDPDHHR